MFSPILTFMATLPIILPVWKEGPMPKNFLKYDSEYYKTTADSLAYQQKAFKVGDPTFKLNVLRLVSTLNDESASKSLYSFLKLAKDSVVKTAILDYLYGLPVIEENLNKIAPLMNNQVAEGIAAARLYIRFKDADLNKVYALLKGTSLKNKTTLVRALAESQKVPVAVWIKTYEDTTDLSFRKTVLMTLASSQQNKASIDFIKKILFSGKQVERAFVAMGLKGTEETSGFYKQMAAAEHASVRQSAARVMGLVIKPEFEGALIKLTVDKDPEVRKTAVSSLKGYHTDASVQGLIEALKDIELLIQKTSVESLMFISAKKDISNLVAKVLAGRASGSRRWSAHILGNLNTKMFADKIDVMLRKEKNADARSEQVYALGQFKHKIGKAMVDSLSKDQSKRVRAKLMIYLAKINDEALFSYIHDAAINDTVGEVRWAALKGCGINGSPWFNKTLVQIMFDLDVNNMRDAQDRACACWAAGKIRGLDKKMYDQMKTTMKQPTIPVPMGPKAYDNSSVLISILFAFVDQSNMGDNDERKYKGYAKSYVDRFIKSTRSVEFPRGYHNDFYALQGERYMKNESIKPIQSPRRRVSWTIKNLSKK
jgi:HEAT repeat protein